MKQVTWTVFCGKSVELNIQFLYFHRNRRKQLPKSAYIQFRSGRYYMLAMLRKKISLLFGELTKIGAIWIFWQWNLFCSVNSEIIWLSGSRCSNRFNFFCRVNWISVSTVFVISEAVLCGLMNKRNDEKNNGICFVQAKYIIPFFLMFFFHPHILNASPIKIVWKIFVVDWKSNSMIKIHRKKISV